MGRAVGVGLAALAAIAALAACGDGDAAAERADQVSDAAADAGLPADVADLLALLGRGTVATYQVVYPSEDGAGEVVVTQRPPDRRVDLVIDGEVRESTVLRDGVRYRCAPDGAGALACERTGTEPDEAGPFDADQLRRAVEAVAERAAGYDLRVVDREVLEVDARCLVTERRPDAPADPESADIGELCLSPEGAVLVASSGAERVAATDYATGVSDGIFDLPDETSG
jgi:hypothetical protein